MEDPQGVFECIHGGIGGGLAANPQNGGVLPVGEQLRGDEATAYQNSARAVTVRPSSNKALHTSSPPLQAQAKASPTSGPSRPPEAPPPASQAPPPSATRAPSRAKARRAPSRGENGNALRARHAQVQAPPCDRMLTVTLRGVAADGEGVQEVLCGLQLPCGVAGLQGGEPREVWGTWERATIETQALQQPPLQRGSSPWA
eukprot:CAMPEP_0176249964 /NCGR_PEP_ID=MMETSP0121_2-20121125/34241_1 /TAXON_ID=160619 /ORGANISM="Kryptoperidinium foliaceum, Strain CCMP 1326" /LENGTH=200 /DNA_ID=CAMNT_0017589665 /DNA_START=186 /DNA_END=787 /DNA_ORIENTATION=-